MNKKSFFKLSGLFLGLTGISFFLIYITNHCLLTISFYEKSGQPVSGLSENQFSVYEAIQRWIYIYATGYLLIKIILIAGIFSTYLFLKGYAISFTRLVTLITASEYLFLVPAFIKFCWFSYINLEADLYQWLHFYPLSLLWLFPNVQAIWIYPLQSLNAFEFVYWFLLAFGMKRLTYIDFDQSLKIVLCSYVPALVAWILIVSFFTLLLFPQAG